MERVAAWQNHELVPLLPVLLAHETRVLLHALRLGCAKRAVLELAQGGRLCRDLDVLELQQLRQL